MRRITAFLLCIVILIPCFFTYTNATEDRTFYNINIDAGNGAICEKAIVQDGEVYIPATSFANYTRYEYRKDLKLFLIKGQELNKAAKSVAIDTDKKIISVNAQKFLELSNYFEADGELYFPLCQILPVLNADIFEIKNNTVYISNNELSLAEVLYDFDVSDYYYNIATEFYDMDRLAMATIIPGYVWDTVIYRFKRLDVVYNSGKYEDYKDALSYFLSDDNLYLKAMAEKSSVIDSTIDLFKNVNDAADKFNSVYSWFEAAAESELNSETSGKLLDVLKEYYASGELQSDNLKALTDAWNGGKISFGDLIEITSYVYTYATQVEDNRQMLNAVYDLDSKISKKETDRKAAKQVYDLYGDNVIPALYKEVATAVTADTLESISPIGIYTATAKIAATVLETFIPYDPSDVAKLPVYSDVVMSALSKYHTNDTLTDESTEDLRLSLLLCLIASKKCYQTMADVFDDYSSVYNSKIEKINQLIMALYIVKNNLNFDSFEHFDEYKISNLKKLKSSGLLEALEKYQFTDKEALEIAKQIIHRYEIYDNMGIACDLEYCDNITGEEYSAIWNLLPEDKRGAYDGFPEKSLCCKTYDQAKQHLLSFIDSSLLKHITETSVVYNDTLYFFVGNAGGTFYKNIELEKFEENEITATANLYNSGDVICGSYRFIIKKQESGAFLLSDIINISKPTDNTSNETNTWTQKYKELLLNFSSSNYAEYYIDQTVPVLFDINNDSTPELFVFCALGSNMLTKNGIMFQIKNNDIKPYYCDDFGYGSGSFNNIKLYKDQDGKTFMILASFNVSEKEKIKKYGNTLVKVVFDENRLITEKIAYNRGSLDSGTNDTFNFQNQKLNDFDSYYQAISDYFSSLTEIKTKNSGKNEKCTAFPVGLYGISGADIDKIFNAYVGS